MPDLLLALDVGTSSVRAGLFSLNGEQRAMASTPVRSTSLQAGRVEQNAMHVWRAVRTMIDHVLAEAGVKIGAVAAVGLTSQRASAVCWDRKTGVPLSPLVVWSDLRGAARALELQQAGFMITPQMAAAKLEAVVAGVGDAKALAAAKRLAWGNIDAFVLWKLSGGGVHATDRSQAWTTGYLDLGTMGWNKALIAHQHLEGLSFPTLVDTWGPMGRTAKSVLGAEIPITAVVADQQSALMAHACDTPGEGKVTYGTSATLNMNTGGEFMYPGPTTPPFILSGVKDEIKFCLEGMVYSAGSAFDWMRACCGLGSVEQFEALAARQRDSEGVYFLPALQGLGAPHGDYDRRGVIGGLSGSTTPGHLARAAMEGLACRVREVVDHLYAATKLQEPLVLRADGGLTANAEFMQVQADMLGRPVARHAIREATACGAAICAGRGVGLLDEADVQAFARYDRTFMPKRSKDEANARYQGWLKSAYG